MKKLTAILFVTFVASILNAQAQDKQVLFNHLTESNGLPTNDVSGVFDDSYSFKWITTREGLIRYDGSNFKLFQHERNNPKSIHNNDITSVCESNDKKLLMGTSNGMSIYNMLTETFEKLYLDKDNFEKSPLRNQIINIIPESDNRFWIVYLNDFSLFDLKTGHFRHFTKQEGFKDHFEKLSVFKLTKGYDNVFYLGIENDHIYKWEKDEWQKLPLTTTTEFSLFIDNHGLIMVGNDDFKLFDASMGYDALVSTWNFTNSKINSIDQDEMGNIWASSVSDGLFMLSPRTKKVVQHFSTQSNPRIPSNEIEKIHVVDNTVFVQLAKGGGILQYNQSTNSFHLFKNNPANPFSISPFSTKYTTVQKDKASVFWITTNNMGIDYVDFKQAKFSILTNESSDEYPIKGANNRGVFAANSSSIWMGNDKALYRYDRLQKTFKTFPHSLVNTIYALNEDDIWVGGSQFINYSYQNGNLIKKKVYNSVASDPTSLTHWYVNFINKTRDGRLWICTAGGLGLLNTDKNTFTNYYYNPNDTTSIPGRLVWHFHEDETGLLWISTQSGLAVFDRKTEKFKQYKHNPKDLNSISSDNVKFVNQDYKGRIWVATEGGGLCVLDKKTDKFITYTSQDGLPSNSVYGIIADENNCFWLSTKKGISTFHPDSMKFTNYFVSDGLQANSFNIQSFSKSPLTKEIIFGGPGGFTIFQPKQIAKSKFTPEIYITTLKIGNQIVTPGKWKNNREILKKTIIETDTLELKHNENSLTLEFASLHYSAPENIQYKYLLEGFDDKWRLANNKSNSAIYTNLPTGKFSFRLKATNCDGIWNQNEKVLFIKITPPWWKTIWFRILFMIGLILAVGWIFILRIFYLERSKLMLKKLVNQKTQELSEKNDKLNEQNMEITEQRENLKYNNEILKNKNTEILNISKLLHDADQEKIRFFTNISHELRTPFSLILSPIESLIEKTENNKQLNSRLKVILTNANRLLRLINQMLDFKRIDENTIALDIEHLDIVDFSKNIFDAHSLITEKKDIHFTFTTNFETHFTYFDPDKVDKILYNLLSNAFKFTPDRGEISLDCHIKTSENKTESYDTITYTIKDNGIGIDKEHINKVFDRFFQVDQTDTRQYEGSGIGLSLTKHLAELHYGNIKLQSEEQKGTQFEVVLAIGEQLKHNQFSTSNVNNNVPNTKIDRPNQNLHVNNKPMLLIVEDNDELRSYIKEELADKYNVLEAGNGKEGFEIAYKQLPEVIISDVMMPVMDGFEMCEIIKNEWITSHIPIVMLTAKVDESSNIQGLEIGADAYIKKPFQMNHLKAQIENLILNRKKLKLRFTSGKSTNDDAVIPDIKKDNFLKKMTLIIEENIANNQFGVELLASNLNMSRSKLYKKTYSILTISAGELIRDIRLKKAAILLTSAEYNITEVASMVGFADHPQFTRSFTNQFGISPKQYQQKNTNKK